MESFCKFAIRQCSHLTHSIRSPVYWMNESVLFRCKNFFAHNAFPHRSGIVLERLESLVTKILQDPPRIPNLNPIGQAWNM